MTPGLPPSALTEAIQRAVAKIEPQLIAWRRDLHQHPELGNREFRTSRVVAEHLRALELDEVRAEVGHTGVVGEITRPGFCAK